MSSFFADDKYDVVIRHLESIGWQRSNNKDGLLWTNLKNIDWGSIDPMQRLNHMKGSQHLSNKSFLAYHMQISGFQKSMPLQWSSAYQDLAQLIGMVTVTALCSLAAAMATETSPTKAQTLQYQGTAKELKSIINVLLMDEQWTCSQDANIARGLLPLLLAQATDPSQISTFITTKLPTLHKQYSLLQDYGGQNVWIVKPVGLSCGENIKIVAGIRPLLHVVKNEMKYKCVVQKYIERPLLVAGTNAYRSGRDGFSVAPKLRKFDIRQWILVTSIAPLVIRGFSEFYCRLSSQEYSLDSEDGALSSAIHLTNHAVQSTLPGALTSASVSTAGPEGFRLGLIGTMRSVETVADRTLGDGSLAGGDDEMSGSGVQAGEEASCYTMLTHAQLEAELQAMLSAGTIALPTADPSQPIPPSQSITANVLLPQMKRIAVECVASVRDKLDRVGQGFEWLGLDFMVTQSLQVLLLECNVSPDISFSTPVTERVVKAATETIFPIIFNTELTSHHDNFGIGDLKASFKMPSACAGENEQSRPVHSDSEVSSFRWELWHDSSSPSSTILQLPSPLALARMKRDEGSSLSSTYYPKKEPLADRVMQILSNDGAVQGKADGADMGLVDDSDEEI